MTDCFMTMVSSKGAEDGSVTQDVEMVFKTCAIGYKKQTDQGTLDQEQKNFVWDIAKMKTEGTVFGKWTG